MPLFRGLRTLFRSRREAAPDSEPGAPAPLASDPAPQPPSGARRLAAQRARLQREIDELTRRVQETENLSERLLAEGRAEDAEDAIDQLTTARDELQERCADLAALDRDELPGRRPAAGPARG